ncbi:hypothetical protein PROFUN_11924 [Planoprotostelium fungivorum]|uniref:Uncharacterized protein n=1 Tax=Planoprotostelium fungivorum TaxID=1890364 RepID=A0A2P6N8T9_9EUKA|nr:hypothetical protein PROFUN_11924 [Planoprotostelium fungivorum]
MPVEGLPLPDIPFAPVVKDMVCFDLGSYGQKDAIMMLKRRGIVDSWYQGAGETGSIDMIRWLEDNEIPHLSQDMSLDQFVGSMDTFRWGLEHSLRLPTFRYEALYEAALRAGCTEYKIMDYCLNALGHFVDAGRNFAPTPDTKFELKMINQVIQSAIDHKYLTRDTRFPAVFYLTVQHLPIIQWMHERQVLHPDFYLHAATEDALEIVQWANVYDKSDEQVYTVLINLSHDVTKYNIEVLEWLLQRRWKKSEAEVQQWFDKEYEDITKEWLEHLWEYGMDEERGRKRKKGEEEEEDE